MGSRRGGAAGWVMIFVLFVRWVGIVVGVHGGACVVADWVEYQYRWVDSECIVECCGGWWMGFLHRRGDWYQWGWWGCHDCNHQIYRCLLVRQMMVCIWLSMMCRIGKHGNQLMLQMKECEWIPTMCSDWMSMVQLIVIHLEVGWISMFDSMKMHVAKLRWLMMEWWLEIRMNILRKSSLQFWW